MSEHLEDPVGHAGTKIVSYVSLLAMATEAIAQVRQQRTAVAAARNEQAAAAVRAQTTSAHAAARLQWQPVLNSRRGPALDLRSSGRAWAAAQAWRSTDPEAELASDRALRRLRELRPDVMERFDRLVADGLEPVEAMHRVAAFFDRPAATHADPVNRAQLTAAASPGDATSATAADPAARGAAAQSGEHPSRSTATAAASTPDVDERRHTGRHAEPALTAAAAQEQPVATLSPGSTTTAAATSAVATAPAATAPVTTDPAGTAPAGTADVDGADVRRVTGGRTPPQVAKDGYPEPLTGAVLAAGRVKPKTPEQTAPAALRSTSLATAARATAARSTVGRTR